MALKRHKKAYMGGTQVIKNNEMATAFLQKLLSFGLTFRKTVRTPYKQNPLQYQNLRIQLYYNCIRNTAPDISFPD